MKLLSTNQKSLFTILLFSVMTTSYAQEFTFGPKAGINIANISFSGSDYSTKSLLGVYIGAFGNYEINEKTSVQPEVLFMTGGTKWTYDFSDGGVIVTEGRAAAPLSVSGKIKTNYISIPVLLQYKITDEIYAEAGPQYNLLLSIKQTINGGSEEDIKEYYKSGTFGISVGAGYDLDALVAGLRANIRYSRDLSDMQKEEVGGGKLKSSMIQIGVSYSFSK